MTLCSIIFIVKIYQQMQYWFRHTQHACIMKNCFSCIIREQCVCSLI